MSCIENLDNRQKIIVHNMYKLVNGDSFAENGLKSLCKYLDYKNYSPVATVERQLGISGISQKYKFPEDINPLEFEALMRPARIFEMAERGGLYNDESLTINFIEPLRKKCMDHVKDMRNYLVELNPELATVPIKENSIHSYVAFISGVCSEFPLEDIKEFCEAIKNDDQEKNNELNKRKKIYTEKIIDLIEEKGMPNSKDKNTLNERLAKKDIFVNWCPSKKSFEFIYKKLNAHLDMKNNSNTFPCNTCRAKRA